MLTTVHTVLTFMIRANYESIIDTYDCYRFMSSLKTNDSHNMAVKEKTESVVDGIEWNVDTEVQLFYAMHGHKPVGKI